MNNKLVAASLVSLVLQKGPPKSASYHHHCYCYSTIMSSSHASATTTGGSRRSQMTTRTAAAAQKKKKRSSTSSNENQQDDASRNKKKKIPKKSSLQGVTTTTTTSTASKNKQPPWYHFFTKGDPDYNKYMREEWGFEKHGSQPLFEKLSLEGAQSGLSWQTILRKREAYRRDFYEFDVERVQHMTEQDVERLLVTTTTTAAAPSMSDSKNKKPNNNIIVRHRGKIQSVIHNAKCIVALQQQQQQQADYLDHFLWSFVNHQPILNRWTSIQDMPTKTAESKHMSQSLKKLGFKFVGPTTCYAFMQSVGMVIDHPVDSPEWQTAYERLQKRPGGYQEGSTQKMY